MKRCPECRRDYFDDTLSFCLDDGAQLVDGPATAELATAILPASARPSENVTKPIVGKNDATEILPLGVANNTGSISFSRKKFWLLAGLVAVLAAAGVLASRYFLPDGKPIESITVDEPRAALKLYWQMSDVEQFELIRQRARYVQTLIGDEPTEYDHESLNAIKVEIDDYVEEKESLSQKPFEEGLRVIYGRGSQLAPLIIKAYEARRVPPALGIYQAMVESEYHDCLVSSIGSVGLFQFQPSTARKYGLSPKDYCNVEKQSDAAARYMADLSSDFVDGRSSATLGLFAFVIGEGALREYLRQMRQQNISERTFWSVFRNQKVLDLPLHEDGKRYVPRFFAVAIIGETPDVFELSTPPLTTLGIKGK